MRKFGILFLVLILIFFFFAGFYLFVVPSNKAATDKYGLLILQQLQTAIQNKMDADIGEYSAYLEHYYFKPGKNKYNLDTLSRQLKRLGVDSLNAAETRSQPATKAAAAGTSADRSGAGTRTSGKAATNGGNPPEIASGDATTKQKAFRPMLSTDTERVIGGLVGIRLGRVMYEFDYGSRSIRLAIPVSRLLGDLDRSFPADFFSAFLFLHSDTSTTTTLYKSDDVPVGLQVKTDSLLKNSKGGFYPGISDLSIGSNQFKLFYIPLIKDDQQYVLCGVKDAAAYNHALHEVPAEFLYPLVIALILLIIALPLVRFYTIGPTETIRIQDLIFMAFSIVGGSMIVTLIIIQLILLKDGEARQQIGLTRLSGQLDSAFSNELTQAFAQLQALDRRRALAPDNWKKQPVSTAPPSGLRNGFRDTIPDSDISDSLAAFLEDNVHPYLNFDRVAWIDGKGMQIVAGSPDASSPRLFIDVSERQYFTDFANNNCYRLPGLDTALVSIQPVLSWSDGSFRFMIGRRSACPDAFLITLSTDLYSVDRTVMPSGYGFCIINDSGLVQVHSEPSRNLVENFLQQSADAAQLKAAMKGRQELYLQQTELYGKEYGLLLEPINNLPYHLVVFYDRGYILPVNLRILVYSVLGCAVTMLSCFLLVYVLMWWVFFRRRWNDRPLLFDTMDFLGAVIPMRSNARAYFMGTMVLEAYVILLLSLAIGGNPYSLLLNNIVIVALLLTPPIVAISLFLIARRYASTATGDSPAYLSRYSLLVLSLVVSLGVVAAALFTWHAQNQELLQSVKRDQLLKAIELDNRRTMEYQPLAHLPAAIPAYPQYIHLQYQTGIYSIFGDRLNLSDTVLRLSLTFDEQYFNVVNRWGDIDYDPQFIPVLRNHSADTSWRWARIEADSILPFEYKLKPDVFDTAIGKDGHTAALAPPHKLLIRSVLPRRYPYLGYPGKALLLVVMIFLLLVALYRVIRRIATEAFLQKWTRGRSDAEDAALPYLQEYITGLIPVSPIPDPHGTLLPQLRKSKLDEMTNAIPLKWPSFITDMDIDKEEIVLVQSASDYSDYFQSVFHRLQPREQYLVYNLACTGFLNYKNVQQIDRLLKEKVLVKDNGRIRLFSPAFRAYIRLNITTDMLGTVVRKSDWQRFRIPFYLLLAVAAAFLFLTQEQAWQRIVALLTALSSTLATVRGLLKGEGEKKAPDGKDDDGKTVH